MESSLPNTYHVYASAIFILIHGTANEQERQMKEMLVRYHQLQKFSPNDLDKARAQHERQTNQVTDITTRFKNMECGVAQEGIAIEEFSKTLGSRTCQQISGMESQKIPSNTGIIIHGKPDAVILDQDQTIVGLVEVKTRMRQFAIDTTRDRYQLACYAQLEPYRHLERYALVEYLPSIRQLHVTDFTRAEMDETWNAIQESFVSLRQSMELYEQAHRHDCASSLMALIQLLSKIFAAYKDEELQAAAIYDVIQGKILPGLGEAQVLKRTLESIRRIEASVLAPIYDRNPSYLENLLSYVEHLDHRTGNHRDLIRKIVNFIFDGRYTEKTLSNLWNHVIAFVESI